ncbi:DUF3152 domain-containing protein [Micromonospora sp. D93]|uniref:DUF3152 domain-containing protein n=1 Tax=Micromonospora sp. D93 TaxID=2824886 RepID=UPI001B36A85E|nr:DUF3152 domain-containing protein [Micromonospora sp. D93]MBQ1021853.1 DUF3152 domain-containing protein [Micromonospora sp. D93]
MPSSARHPVRRRRRFALLAQLVAVVVAVGAAVTVIAEGPGGHPGADRLAVEQIGAPPPLVAGPLPPSADPPPSDVVPSSLPPVLRVPGAVPSAGTGRFGYDVRSGPVLGRAGELRRYRVAVESGSDEDAAGFAQAVQVALAGPGSWVDSGRLRLQQVPGAAPRDFTVYLATARTAGRMCAEGGVDIRVGGRPYTSCRAPGKVIINLDRWRLSVPHFVSAGVQLSVYRTYVVNHEVGHQLGHRHERCPGRGRPAPVMMQQTLFLDGCRVNPWPYVGGRRYAGPAL